MRYALIMALGFAIVLAGLVVRAAEPETSLKNFTGRVLYALGAAILFTASLWSN